MRPRAFLRTFRIAAITLAALIVGVAARAEQPQALTLSGAYWGTHDPSIIKAGNTWYVFATGRARDGGQFQIRCSTDLHAWKLCGHVFDQIPEWIRKASPGTRELWAPDISYENGEYRLYLRLLAVREEHVGHCAGHQQDAGPRSKQKFARGRAAAAQRLPLGWVRVQSGKTPVAWF